MKNSKHTPGPWKVETGSRNLRIKASVGRQIASIVRHPGDNPEIPMREFIASDIDRANAHLIAAAPEMLEALESIEKELRDYGYKYTSGIDLVLKAIRKARGEK
jgi:vacuolar-type H+-ATPase subunit C/Vma6